MTATRTAMDAQEASAEGACCAACAVREAKPVPSGRAALPSLPVVPVVAVATARALPMLEPAAGPPRTAIARGTDRRITFAGLLVAGAFLAIALLGLAHLLVGRTGPWIPLHLALAGAASTAVASVLPFFSAALAAAAPADARLRGLAIGGVAGGALAVSIAVPLGVTVIAIVGGLAYVAGIGLVAIVALGPLSGALGVRRPLVERAYGLALLQVGIGVLLAIGMVAGMAPIAERWGLLKPAHAWLNVFGFLSVVIAATLVHLAPTVVGARIQPRPSALVAVSGLVGGAPLIAVGLALASNLVVRIGAAVEIAGAIALVGHAIGVQRGRGRWTTDPAWHRLTAWSLLLAPGWLLVAVAIAAGRFLWLGADPAAWSIALIAAPLAVGFVAQVLVGSWSHLVPAIGPGDQAAHARQRGILGRFATPRIAALNGGALLASMGALSSGPAPAVAPLLTVLGLVLAVGSLATAIALLGQAAWTRGAEVSGARAF
jgi:nitrite reductase (NO-forming)